MIKEDFIIEYDKNGCPNNCDYCKQKELKCVLKDE